MNEKYYLNIIFQIPSVVIFQKSRSNYDKKLWKKYQIKFHMNLSSYIFVYDF